MCQLTDDLLLCSCEGETLRDPDWLLERLDPDRPLRHRRGRAMIPRFNADEQALQARVLGALSAGCFDFAYDALPGDVLRLRLGARWFRFRFDHSGWAVDDSTSLTGWRAQMVPLDQGKLGKESGASGRSP